MEKLKDPSAIKEIINEKTKKLLDEGKLQEAKKLITLGEKIPQKLSQEVNMADQYRDDALFKKAKKSYFKAAELAEDIQEMELAKLLKKRGEKVGTLTDILKTFEAINKGIKKTLGSVKSVKLDIYENLIPLIEKNVKLSSSLQDNSIKKVLQELNILCKNAARNAKELIKFDKDIKNLIKKM